MNIKKILKEDGKYLAFYFSAMAVLFYFVKLDDKDYANISYKELAGNDSALLLKDTVFANGQLKANTTTDDANTVQLVYQPIRSINQTFVASVGRKAKAYTFKLREIDTTPQLLEARISRVKVSLEKYYEMPKWSRLLSFTFNEMVYAGKKMHYQFAMDTLGNYEDFCDDNKLTIQLPLGKHNLYIRAVDFAQHITTKYCKISAYTRVSFSKRDFFWPLMLLICLSPFFYYFYKFKLNRQKYFMQEQLALEKQRNKMTADLHDDIGAALSSLQINSAVAGKLLYKNPAEANVMLEKIQTLSEDLADKIGDFIWSIKTGKDEFLSISARIKNFVNEILGATNIAYHIHVDEQIDYAQLNTTARKNIVFIVKEAVNNVAKYSSATNVTIAIKINNEHLMMEVSDNGDGFTIADANGNGIGNMRRRVEELGGQLTIETAKNEGTSVKANIPLSLNYGTN